jgi:hypothetical protein
MLVLHQKFSKKIVSKKFIFRCVVPLIIEEFEKKKVGNTDLFYFRVR